MFELGPLEDVRPSPALSPVTPPKADIATVAGCQSSIASARQRQSPRRSLASDRFLLISQDFPFPQFQCGSEEAQERHIQYSRPSAGISSSNLVFPHGL